MQRRLAPDNLGRQSKWLVVSDNTMEVWVTSKHAAETDAFESCRNGAKLWFHKLEKEMATHSSMLTWWISWTEEPGRVQSMGLQRVGHDWSDLAHKQTTVKNLLFVLCFLGGGGGSRGWQRRNNNRYSLFFLVIEVRKGFHLLFIYWKYYYIVSWVFIGRTDVEAETPVFWPPDVKRWLIWKDPDVGKDWRQEEKVTTEDEMVIWHHRLNGHEFG